MEWELCFYNGKFKILLVKACGYKLKEISNQKVFVNYQKLLVRR